MERTVTSDQSHGHLAHAFEKEKMLTVPMYTTPPLPDASHRVGAPGGYEWWYFDAEDASTDTRVVAILFDGFVFHPGYLRAIESFRKHPTKVTPPLPGEYPCAYLAVYRQNKLLGQFMSQFPAGSCIASTEVLDVAVGPNSVRRQADGAIQVSMTGRPWVLTGRGPKTLIDQTLSAELTFKPRFEHPPEPRRFLSREMTDADHCWILANPLCDVTGNVRLTNDTMPIIGRGYHDHNLGTGPIGDGLQRWMWGRVLEPDRVTTFHAATPIDPHLPQELHLMESDNTGAHVISATSSHGDWNRLSSMLLRYPGSWSIDDRLTLRNPKVIDSTPFYLRLLYDATLNGRSTQAFCEIAYPHRLRWPVLGRMIEMSIDRA